jgi:hypothetical protein
VRIAVRVIAAMGVLYALLFATVLGAMSSSPGQFGRFMRYAPAPVVWGALPAERMWLWARRGTLRVGDRAPDFSLPLQKGNGQATLSSFRGKQPVVLVFGSYT